MKITVVYAAPGIECVELVELPAGATLDQAVKRSGIEARLPAHAVSYAIHGERARPETPLADGDRVEILRPLLVDPQAARRARAAHHPLPTTRKVKRRSGA